MCCSFFAPLSNQFSNQLFEDIKKLSDLKDYIMYGDFNRKHST